MVADAARGDLEAVADHVVLERLDDERILRLCSASMPPCGIENGLWREVDPLLVLVPFVEREVDDPAQLKAVPVDEVRAPRRPRLRACAGEPGELLRITGDEEGGVPVGESELLPDRLGALRADVLGDRAGAFDASPSLRQKI